MSKEFIPYEQALELKELGFNDDCIGYYYIDPNAATIPILCIYKPYKDEYCLQAPIYQQAFRWFREKYGFTFSIGKTNISVVHVPTTTQLLQNNANYEAAELTTIKYFIEIAKQIPF